MKKPQNQFQLTDRVVWKKQGQFGHYTGEVIRVGKKTITVIFDYHMGREINPFTRSIKPQNLDYSIILP